MIHLIKNFFALGFGFELGTTCDAKFDFCWTSLHVKLFLGPAVANFSLRVGRKRRYEF